MRYSELGQSGGARRASECRMTHECCLCHDRATAPQIANGRWQMANGKWVEIERRLADLRASPPISILQLGRKPLFKTGPMRHLRNFLSAVLVIGSLSAGLFVTGCGKSEPASQSTTDDDKKAKYSYTIGMSKCNLGDECR